MPLMSALSRHVFHPLWDLKDRSHRLRDLRALERAKWLRQESLRERQRQRLGLILRYAAAHSSYYARLFRAQRFDPADFSLEAFTALPLLTKAIIRSSTDDMLSDEFARSALGEHRTGGSTGVALTTYFDQDWLELRQAGEVRADSVGGYIL